jgi:hypothetical protein
MKTYLAPLQSFKLPRGCAWSMDSVTCEEKNVGVFVTVRAGSFCSQQTSRFNNYGSKQAS